MLETLLKLVAEGGIHSYEELAGRLQISRPLLEMMLDNLARLGYLRAIGEDCAGSCHGCAAGGCSIAGPGRLWALTEEGLQSARRACG